MRKIFLSVVLLTVTSLAIFVTGCTNNQAITDDGANSENRVSNPHTIQSAVTTSKTTKPTTNSTSKATQPTNTTTKATEPAKKTYYCDVCHDVVVSSKGDVCKSCICPACGCYNYPTYDSHGVRRPFCQNCNCRYSGCYYPVMRAGGFWCELHACHKEGCSKQAEKDSLYCEYHQ